MWRAPNSSWPKLGRTWWSPVLSFAVGSSCWYLTPEGPRCRHPTLQTFLPFWIPCPQGPLLSSAFLQGLLFAGAKWMVKVKGRINKGRWVLCESRSPSISTLFQALHCFPPKGQFGLRAEARKVWSGAVCTRGTGQAAGVLGIAVFRLTSVWHSLGNKSCVTVSARVSAKCIGSSGKAVCTGLGGWVVLPTDPELV